MRPSCGRQAATCLIGLMAAVRFCVLRAGPTETVDVAHRPYSHGFPMIDSRRIEVWLLKF